MARLISIVETIKLTREKEDIWLWTLYKNGNFSLKSCVDIFGDTGMYDEIWKYMWRLKVPSKVKFFLWFIIRDRLLITDNLIKKGMCLPNICLLCYQEEETANHILLHCPYSKEVQDAVLNEIGVTQVFPRSIREFFGGWHLRRALLKIRKALSLVLPTVWWSIWLQRNQRVFENNAEPAYNVYRKVKDRFFI